VYRYIGSRLLQTILTAAIISALVFLFMNLAGDPAALLLPPEANATDVTRLRHSLGLDRPAYVQYFVFMRALFAYGQVKSFRYQDPMLSLIASHLLRTLALAVASLGSAVVLALPLGALVALQRGRWIDVALRVLVLLGESVPAFVSAILLVYVFAVKWRLVPVEGLGARNAILPIVTLVLFQLAVLLRLFRSEILEVMDQDYIRTGRAKGLSTSAVLVRHAFKNAAIPVLAMSGLLLNSLVLGSVVVEPIFAWPGIGYLIVESVLARDYPVVVAGATVIAVIIALVNLATDILHAMLDPRVRMG